LKSTYPIIKFHNLDSIIRTFLSINSTPIKTEIKSRGSKTELKLEMKKSIRGGGIELKIKPKKDTGELIQSKSKHKLK